MRQPRSAKLADAIAAAQLNDESFDRLFDLERVVRPLREAMEAYPPGALRCRVLAVSVRQPAGVDPALRERDTDHVATVVREHLPRLLSADLGAPIEPAVAPLDVDLGDAEKLWRAVGKLVDAVTVDGETLLLVASMKSGFASSPPMTAPARASPGRRASTRWARSAASQGNPSVRATSAGAASRA